MTNDAQFWCNILAIALSLVIAVQASEFLQRRRASESRRLEVFRALMVTRAERLSPEHVRALNLIDLEFNRSGGSDPAVRASWKKYLSFLENRVGFSGDLWNERGNDHVVELLKTMALACGYSIDETDLRRSIYRPKFHNRIDQDNEKLRQAVLALFEGRTSLGIHPVEPPQPVLPPSK